MSDSQRVALGNTLAGTNQFKILSAVMSQMDVAQEAYTQALESSGTTMQQNEKYMEGLEAKTNLLKSELEQLVLGEGGIQQFSKNMVDLATNMVKFGKGIKDVIDKLGGLPSLLSVIITYLTFIKGEIITDWLMVKYASILSSLKGLLGGINNIIHAIPNAITAWKAYSAGIVTANTAIQASVPLIGLALTAISGLTIALGAYNNAQSEQMEQAIESINAYNSYIDSINSTISAIQDENTSKEKLIDINSQLNDSYDAEQGKLKDIIDLRKEATQALFEEAKAKAINVETTSSGAYLKAKKELEEATSIDSTGLGVHIQFENIYKKLEFYENAIVKLNQKREQGIELEDSEINNLIYLQSCYDEIRETISKNEEIITNYDNATKVLSMTYEEWINYVGDATKSETDYANALTDAEEDIDEYNQLLEEQQKAFEKLQQQFALSSTTVTKLKTNYELLQKSVQEVNEQGALSIETYEELMSLSPAYLQALFDENGALRTNIDAQEELYKIKIEQMALDQVSQLLAIVDGYVQQGKAIESLNTLMAINTDLTFANAKTHILDLEATGDITAEVANALLNQITQYEKWAEQATKSVKKYTKEASATAVKETKSALETIKEQIQSTIDKIKDSISDYEKAISYIKKLIDKKIDAVKEEKEATIDSIQAQIDALEKLSDAEQDSFESQIDDLEKAKDLRDDELSDQIDQLEALKDAEEDYWDEKINALKEQNSALKDQLEYEQLLEALEKAKSTKVKVYREGQGFVYESDAGAISSAQQKIDEYNTTKKYEEELASLEKSKEEKVNSYTKQIADLKDFRTQTKEEFEKQIADLKEQKENAKKVRDEEIQNLKDYKEEQEKYYDAQTKQFEQYKDQFQEQLDAYEDAQGKLLASQLFGINTEEENWETRLGNLGTFVNQYHEKLKELEKYEKELANVEAQISSASASNSGSTTTSKISDDGNNGDDDKPPKYLYNGKLYDTRKEAQNALDEDLQKYPVGSVQWRTLNSQGNKIQEVTGYASGVASVSGSQIAVTGEDPNKEIVLGSKANGTLTRIDNGGGVVNAKSTKTLAGLLNQIGSYALNSFNTPNQSNNSLSSSNDTVFNISSINVQADNADDFVRSMTQFKMQMTQRAYSV